MNAGGRLHDERNNEGRNRLEDDDKSVESGVSRQSLLDLVGNRLMGRNPPGPRYYHQHHHYGQPARQDQRGRQPEQQVFYFLFFHLLIFFFAEEMIILYSL